jgi:hypothetical protein
MALLVLMMDVKSSDKQSGSGSEIISNQGPIVDEIVDGIVEGED